MHNDRRPGSSGHDELGVETDAAILKAGVVAFGFVQHLSDRLIVPLPVGPQILLHHLNCVAFGIAHEEMP